MESLEETAWDVLIVGTGLQESLLALACSRSDKKILHVDKNDYYGGSEAAFSLQDAEDWVKNNEQASDSPNLQTCFRNAKIHATAWSNDGNDSATTKLSFPRAYSLALAPQIIYARSALLPALVTSKVDLQLEFLAVGSWFVYNTQAQDDQASLFRIPNGREDIIADSTLDLKAKRGLMKFLKFIGNYEEQVEVWEEHKDESFYTFLTSRFNFSEFVLTTIQALVLSTWPRTRITTAAALPRIAMHLRSIGLFGAGFGAVIPKWGGLAEIAQVGCRAGAVGGGVYVLGNGLKAMDKAEETVDDILQTKVKAQLEKGETVRSKCVVFGHGHTQHVKDVMTETTRTIHRSIHVVASALSSLFPPISEGGPNPAVAVIAIPTAALGEPTTPSTSDFIFIMVHSSETGECPKGQSILYCSVEAESNSGSNLLDKAANALLSTLREDVNPRILWTLHYQQVSKTSEATQDNDTVMRLDGSTLAFPPFPLDLAFDDCVLDRVKDMWQRIIGSGAEDFLVFPMREGMQNDDEEIEN